MATSVLEKRKNTDIKELIEHQKEIKKYLKNVEKKIFSLEQTYLDETPGGNVVRGWEAESKPFNKKGIEPKERLFSNSSYHVFQDYKPIQDELAIEAKITASNTKVTKAPYAQSSSEPKKKKKRKARKEAKPPKAIPAAAASYDHEWTADY
jgi:hypothetical protein